MVMTVVEHSPLSCRADMTMTDMRSYGYKNVWI